MAAVSDAPRILFCCFDVVPGPHPLSRRLGEYLKGLGDRFQTVVLSRKDADHSHIERYQGARLLRVPVGTGDISSQLQMFDRAVRRQLDSEEYLVAHFFDPFVGLPLCERKADFGYKLVFDASNLPSIDLAAMGTESDGEAERRLVARARRQELFCLLNADAVIVGSDVSKRYVTALGVSAEAVHTLRAPVDLAPYTPELMGAPDHASMKMVHLGSAAGFHDLKLAIEAVALASQTADLSLAIVGPQTPGLHEPLVALVEEKKLGSRVEFQPPVAHDDLHKILSTADVGLLTLEDGERNRNFGGALARAGEYLASGRPIIAADLPVVHELLPASARVLYRPGDARSLSDAMVELASDVPRRVQLGAAGREHAALWSTSRAADRLVTIYETLTNRSLVPSSSLPVDADGPTQLGAAPGSPDSNIGTNKVKTDPAIPHETNKVKTDPSIQGAVDPEARTDMGSPTRGPIMGVPLREGEDALPVVSGEVLAAAEEPAGPVTQENQMGSDEAQRPSGSSPTLPPVLSPPIAEATEPLPVAKAHFPEPSPDDEAAEVSEDDVMQVEGVLEGDEDVPEADAISLDAASASLGVPDSAVGLWFAQLVHGWCPPESNLFARHTPPTTTPGKDS